jgi:hypothetical protein
MDVKACDRKGGLDWTKEKSANTREVTSDDGGRPATFGLAGGCETYCPRNSRNGCLLAIASGVQPHVACEAQMIDKKRAQLSDTWQ